MKRNTKRILILLLTAALVLGMMPAAAFGEEAPEAVGAGDSASQAAFQDVTGSDWFYGPVTEMTGEGLMNGVADGVFDPQGTATRGMLVTVIWRMEGCVKPSHRAVCRFSAVTEVSVSSLSIKAETHLHSTGTAPSAKKYASYETPPSAPIASFLSRKLFTPVEVKK